MSNLCIGGGGQFVDRSAVAEIVTPQGTASWKPVPHIEVIDAVSDVVKAHNWVITDEQFGLAREGQKLFGVMKINKTSCAEWTRCIGFLRYNCPQVVSHKPNRTSRSGRYGCDRT